MASVQMCTIQKIHIAKEGVNALEIKAFIETDKCPGCGWHMIPQTSGDESPDWEECQNPECEYEEE